MIGLDVGHRRGGKVCGPLSDFRVDFAQIRGRKDVINSA